MNKLKKITIISLFFFWLIIVNLTFAQPWSVDDAVRRLANQSPIRSPDDIFRILAKITQYVYTIFFIVAVIYILMAAFSFLNAQGSPEKIQKARNALLWALVAIAVALISGGIAQIIKNFLTI